MNKFIGIVFLLGQGLALMAADGPVTSIKVNRFKHEHVDLAINYAIANPYATHVIAIQQTKNTDKSPSILAIHAADPNVAIGRHAGLFQLQVNGLSSRVLQISEERIQRWADEKSGAAGCEILLNFDGAKIRIRIFMIPNSPLLQLSLFPSPDSIEPINSIELSTHACIKLNKDPQTRWMVEAYAREVVTPKRVITESKGVLLDSDENALVMRDRVDDGSDPDKGEGPGYLIFDPSAISKATLTNGVYQQLVLNIKPDFQEVKLGFWRDKKRRSNAEFDEFRKANPELFSLEGKK